MTMYRIHHRLAVKGGQTLEKGGLSQLEWLKENGIDRLILKGAISRVHAPPLEILPGWHEDGRARKINEVLAIKDAEQFLEADVTLISEKMGVSLDEVERWKGKVLDALMIKVPTGC